MKPYFYISVPSTTVNLVQPWAQSKLQHSEGQIDAALRSLRGAVDVTTQAFGPDAPQSYYVRAQLAIFLR